MTPLMTQSAYARRIKVNRSTVNRLVKKGVIPVNEAGEIDPETADRAYLAALHPGYEHSRRAQLPLGVEVVPPPGSGATAGAMSAPAAGHDEALFGLGDRSAYKVYATQEKRAKALLADLELDERMARLVEAKQVEMEAFRTFREVRDALLNIPGRVSGVLASELGLDSSHGQGKVFDVLTREINEALEGVAHAVRQS